MAIIIFSIFKALACFSQPFKCWTNNITLMYSSIHTLLFDWHAVPCSIIPSLP
jgi:hypothetical protein